MSYAYPTIKDGKETTAYAFIYDGYLYAGAGFKNTQGARATMRRIARSVGVTPEDLTLMGKLKATKQRLGGGVQYLGWGSDMQAEVLKAGNLKSVLDSYPAGRLIIQNIEGPAMRG